MMPYGDEIQGEIDAFNTRNVKTAAKKTGQTLKEMLASATEPLFRLGLGERHFTVKEAYLGGFLWFVCAIIPIVVYRFVHHFPVAYLILATLVPLLVLAKYCRNVRENSVYIADIRARKLQYHTKSRGQRRFASQREEKNVRRIAALVLFVCSPVTGIAFTISNWMTTAMANQQLQDIENVYLDHKYGEIEANFLQSALSGKTPPEVTWLYDSLPTEKYNQTEREDIANVYSNTRPRSMVTKRRSREGQNAASSEPGKQSSPPPQSKATETTVPSVPPVPAVKPFKLPKFNFERLRGFTFTNLMILSVLCAATYFYFKKPASPAKQTEKPAQPIAIASPTATSKASDNTRQSPPITLPAQTGFAPRVAERAQQPASTVPDVAAQYGKLRETVAGLIARNNEFVAVIETNAILISQRIDGLSFWKRTSFRNENDTCYTQARSAYRTFKGSLEFLDLTIDTMSVQQPAIGIQTDPQISIQNFQKECQKQADEMKTIYSELISTQSELVAKIIEKEKR